MIIKLTLEEVKKYVGNALGMHSGTFDLEIVNPPDTSLLDAFRAAIREFPFYTSYEKISAINRFRELAPKQVDRDGDSSCSVGLADAKWAVENAGLTLLNLERTGSIRG